MTDETVRSQKDKSDEIDLWEVASAIWRGKFIVLFMALAATALGGYYAFRIAEPQFSSTVTLALQVRNQQVVDIESVVSGVSTEEEAINTELEVIKSRELLERLVEDLDLAQDPTFNLRLQEVPTFSVRGIKDFITELFGSAEEEEEPSKEEIRRIIADQLRKSIVVSAHNDTYLFSIRVLTNDPEKSAAIANRLSEIYLDNQIDIKFAATEAAVDWLSERVETLQFELKSREDAVKALRSETNLISIETLEVLNLRAKDLRERVTNARNDVLRETARVATIVEQTTNRDYQAAAVTLNDPILLRLAPSATSSGATDIIEFRARMEAVTEFRARLSALLDDAQQDLDQVTLQRDTLQQALEQLQTEISDQNADLAKLNQLIQEAEATKILYNTFLTRLKETSVQVGLQQPDSRILSRAVDGQQIAPRRSRIFVLSFILGSMIGAAVVVARRFLYQGVRSLDELENLVGLPVLGAIPKIPIRQRKSLLGYLSNHSTSAAVEAIRNLRTSIIMSNIDVPPKVIAVTSGIPAEGKTTMAIALAHNFAGLDKKVLLIDGDIRRRTLSQHISLPAASGLVSAMTGERDLSDVIETDPDIGIDFLFGEKSSKNAADVFASQKFIDLIAKVREQYDYVIIDTPPVLIVPDARIIAKTVDAILYAALWNSTPQATIKAGVRQFTSLDIKVDGMVLSKIDPRGMRKYGDGGTYGSYAAYGYAKGYYDS